MMYFGTDGIRGKAYDTLPLLRAYQLGVAISKVYPKDEIIVGYDTRASSLDFVYALMQGLETTNAYVAGMVPTPVIAYYSQVNKVIGVMITASHNPYQDNGLKVFEYGFKVSESSKVALEKIMLTIDTYEKKEIALMMKDVSSQYKDFVESLYPHEHMSDYVIDCAHGATSELAPVLFSGKHYFYSPNGQNINESCGATYMQAALDIVGKHRVALSFDGDGDRMLMILDDEIIYGDQLLYVFAKDMMLKGENVSVALSVMTNPGVLRAFEDLGVNVYETPVGDAYLFEAIKNQYATIGAEASGHYMLSFDNGVEHVLIGDGMLAAKKIIDIMSRYGIDVVKLWLEEISMVPMTTKNLNLDRARLDRDDIKECIEQLKKHVISPYKLIVRPSGTEDKIRLTVSLPTQKEVNDMLDQLTRCLERG